MRDSVPSARYSHYRIRTAVQNPPYCERNEPPSLSNCPRCLYIYNYIIYYRTNVIPLITPFLNSEYNFSILLACYH